MKLGAKGIKTQVSGRLGGVDIARTIFRRNCSTSYFTCHIDYAHAKQTLLTVKGVKVWIYRGEVLPTKNTSEGGK